jgi:hypothetical protein
MTGTINRDDGRPIGPYVEMPSTGQIGTKCGVSNESIGTNVGITRHAGRQTQQDEESDYQSSFRNVVVGSGSRGQ